MPFSDVTFWIGLTVAGTGLYFLIEGEKARRPLSLWLTLLGMLIVAFAVHPSQSPSGWVWGTAGAFVLCGLVFVILASEWAEERVWQVPQQSQNVGASLLDLIHFATNTLLHAQIGSQWTIQTLRDRIDQWEHDVLAALSDAGSSATDRSYFNVLVTFPTGLGGVNTEHAHLRDMLAEKIRRLREITARIEASGTGAATSSPAAARLPTLVAFGVLAILAFTVPVIWLATHWSGREPDLRLEIGNSSPFLMQTQYDKYVHVAVAGSDGKTNSDAPHKLWMIVLTNNMTIWNASPSQSVSLQFTFRTTLAGPVTEFEYGDNNLPGNFQTALLQRSEVPITLREDGSFRNQTQQIPGVLPGGADKWPYLKGPLDIKASDHATGTLAFFYEQLDEKNCRVNFWDGELIITDKLSATSLSRFLKGGRWQ